MCYENWTAITENPITGVLMVHEYDSEEAVLFAWDQQEVSEILTGFFWLDGIIPHDWL